MADTLDQEALANFCSITGATPEVAATYMQVTDGQVEQAISLYLESDGSYLGGAETAAISHNPPDFTVQGRAISTGGFDAGDAPDIDQDAALARQLAEEEEQRSSSTRSSDNDVRAPIAPRRDVLFGDDDYESGVSFVHRPPRVPYAPPAASSIFDQREPLNSPPFRIPDLSHTETYNDGMETGAAIGSGSSAASDKRTRLAELFRPPFEIMAKGDFEHARGEAKSSTKWLLVNVQEMSEFACQVLNRDLWSDTAVRNVVKENFVFMQLNSTSVEGKKYINFYPITNYPHIAVIDPRTGERIKEWNIQIDPAEFLMEVTEFLEANSLTNWTASVPHTERKKRAKLVSEMSEEEQLNAALAASMDNAEDLSVPDLTALESSMDSAASSAISNGAGTGVEHIAPMENVEPAPGDPNGTRVQIRMAADGSRQVRRFYKTDPVRTLFAYIKATEPSAKELSFDLVFHRESLSQKINQTISDAGLENASITMETDV